MSCSLRSLRARIESLATSGGRFGVACARTGVTPVPIDGLWFESREDAGLAVDLAAAYRARLRRYDPTVQRHDLVVHECPLAVDAGIAARSPPAAARAEQPVPDDD